MHAAVSGAAVSRSRRCGGGAGAGGAGGGKTTTLRVVAPLRDFFFGVGSLEKSAPTNAASPFMGVGHEPSCTSRHRGSRCGTRTMERPCAVEASSVATTAKVTVLKVFIGAAWIVGPFGKFVGWLVFG